MKLWKTQNAITLFAASALLAGCMQKIPDVAVGGGTGASGVSPTSVELQWTATTTADSYQVFNLQQGSTPIYSTLFNDVVVGTNSVPAAPFVKDTNYSLSVRGVRGTAQDLSDPINTWTLHTWTDFSNTNFTQTLQTDGTTLVGWDYAPWNTTGLAASLDAVAGMDIQCLFLPVAQGTNPSLITNFDSTYNGNIPSQLSYPLYPGHFTVAKTDLDMSKYYATQCSASYTDNTTSTVLPSKRFLLTPAHVVAACPIVGSVGSAYQCSPSVRAQITEGGTGPAYFNSFKLVLSPSNTCSWAAVDSTSQNIVVKNTGSYAGLFLNQDAGACNLAYIYQVYDSSNSLQYTSPIQSSTVTVTVPLAYTTFPSFAVRALSGSLGFPLAYAQATGTTATSIRARVASDIFSDFGNGDSNLFVGGTNPFPTLTGSSLALPNYAFYGFPLSQISSGVRPLGYSLDAIRPTTAPNGNNTLEGFIRGALVVPNATISNATFISQTGRGTGTTVSLYNFLSNAYGFTDSASYSGHTSGATTGSASALSTFLSTNSNFSTSSPPLSAGGFAYTGQLVQQTTVAIHTPTVQTITSYIPSTGTPGVVPVIVSLDTARPYSGLVQGTGSGQNTFVTNCPASYTTDAVNHYGVPSSCSGAPTIITCYGDVIVNNPLLLVDANILTDSGGCRLYVTGTVFIEGTLKAYDASLATQTVQISSASGIVIGFSKTSLGVSTTGTQARTTTNTSGLLDMEYAGDGSTSYPTNPFLTSRNDGPLSASAALDSIANDASTVGLITTTTSGYAIGQITSTSTNIALSHIALNAPYIFSSYPGMFTGSVAAEVAIFPVLNFTADATLKGLAAFPMYKNNVGVTGTDGTDDRVLVVTP